MSPLTVHVHLTPALVAPERLAGTAVAVIDTLRATTTLAHALAAGCAMVLPCLGVDDARARAATFPAGTALLAGERDGVPLPGFDLGNSPAEATPGRVAGRVIVMTTTNGTRALLHAGAADLLVTAAFVNLSAVAERLAGQPRPVHILCAGDAGAVALEDALTAGALVERLAARGARPDDGAVLARAAYRGLADDLEAVLRGSSGGARLRHLGYDEDIRVAARLDSLTVVPVARPHAGPVIVAG